MKHYNYVIKLQSFAQEGVGAILIARNFEEKAKNIAKKNREQYNIQGARKENYARKYAHKKKYKNKRL